MAIDGVGEWVSATMIFFGGPMVLPIVVLSGDLVECDFLWCELCVDYSWWRGFWWSCFLGV